MAAPETESKELDQDEIIEEEVESSEEQDETLEDESLEEDLGDETEEEEAQPSFDRAFTQFQGETVEEYAKNLEEGYRNTSKEGLRLSATNKELEVRVNQLMAAVAKNPELAATLNATQDNKPAAPSAAMADPALAYFKSEFEAKMVKEYDSFVDEHPELTSDETLANKVNQRLANFRNVIFETEGRQIGMQEGLEMAWTSLGLPLTESKQEATAMAVKSQASQPRKQGGKPTVAASRSQFSDDQVEFARRLYPGLSTEDLEKKLSENLAATTA